MTRILFLLFLGMMAYFLIRNRLSGPRKLKDRPRQEAKPDFPGAAVMEIDPTCGVYVDPAEALYYVDSQGKHYFCSAACREKFLTGRG